MPTIPVSQVASTSIDTAGISVATAPPSADNPRAGTIYDPAILANPSHALRHFPV